MGGDYHGYLVCLAAVALIVLTRPRSSETYVSGDVCRVDLTIPISLCPVIYPTGLCPATKLSFTFKESTLGDIVSTYANAGNFTQVPPWFNSWFNSFSTPRRPPNRPPKKLVAVPLKALAHYIGMIQYKERSANPLAFNGQLLSVARTLISSSDAQKRKQGIFLAHLAADLYNCIAGGLKFSVALYA